MFSVKALVLFSALSAQGDSQLLHFSATWCQPCREMEPIVAQLEQAGYCVRHVDVDRQREIAQRYDVQGVPCFVLLRNGRESDRVVGRVSYARLHRMFQVAPAPGRSNQAQDGQIRGQSPETSRVASTVANTLGTLPRLLGKEEPNGRSADTLASADGRLAPTWPTSSSSPARRASAEQQRPNGAGTRWSTQDPRQRALAATVRLRVDDDRGRSYGTGTIIDARGDEALVVTCGHIFRDSDGKGLISVDLFHSQTSESTTGTLVGYDLDRDVGLVSFRLPVRVAPVPVAGIDYRVQPGQAVFAMGCDRGGAPREMDGTINALNRYSGPPSLSVSGQPVDGRSGGGLFSSDGYLIGVCNAADPQDNEGLYAAAGTVHAELDRSGLSFVYRRNGESLAQEPSGVPNAGPVPESDTRGVRPPDLPTVSPDQRAPSLLTSVDDSEVICIIRSRSNPRAPSQVFRLDQPSADFLAHVAQEAGSGAGPEVTADLRAGRTDVAGRNQGPARSSPSPAVVPIVRGQTR